jgi:Tol biopolymer transport system component
VYRPFALAALLLGLTAACGGSGGAEQDGAGNGGGAAPDGLSLVVYKDTAANTVFAELPPGQRYWEFGGETDKDFLLGISCATDGKRAAYLMQSTDSGLRLKISDRSEPIAISGQSSGITWAPDGSKIALTTFDTKTSVNQLQLVDTQTGQVSTVASGQGAIGPPRWSPDGSRIVFDASDGQLNQIFVYKIGDAAATKLKERPDNAFAPDWSPDGSALVFVALGPGQIHQIYKMNADGSNETQLTSSNVTKALPRWAPDGSLIAFAGTIAVPTASERPALVHNLGVFTVKPDGSDERSLTDVARDARLGGWCIGGPWLNENWKAQ